jgi:hypothetical protein
LAREAESIGCSPLLMINMALLMNKCISGLFGWRRINHAGKDGKSLS